MRRISGGSRAMKALMLYAAVGGGAFMVVAALVPLFRWLALRLDVVDKPASVRKVHSREVPYLGGLPFFIAFLCLILGLEFFAPRYAQPEFYPMAVFGFLVMLLGVFDDICDLSSKIKLPLELLLCGALYFFGFGSTIIMRPFGGALYIGGFAIVITALWIAGVMNAVNFSDGLDGLAAGLVCICSLSIFAVAFQGNRVSSCILMAFLTGATLAFLCYNFHPASVFMGDAGALFLGFILGSSTLIEQQKGVAVIALTIPMMVMAVPLADTALSFLRRLRRASQGGFFEADRNHLHHRLLALGLSQRQAVLSLYYISACMGLLAFILSGVSSIYRFFILALAAGIILFGVLVLQYLESVARRGRE
jgi:UDP-GlcNAc:undecaprenyl-phosphate GlcNAc-1-phosphate transferase